MKRGDMVEVKSGRFAGRTGKAICVFRGLVTVLGPAGLAFQVKVDEVEVVKEEAHETA